MEENLSRKRALAEIRFEEWLSYNPLFHTYIPEFSEAFNRGSSLDLNYYVKRKIGESNRYYEDDLCDSLFTASNNAKLSYLSAKVGNGKTSLCRYITLELNKKKDYLVFYVDIGSSERDTSNIIQLLRDVILDVLVKRDIIENKRVFCEGIFSKSGFKDLTPNEMLDRYEKLSYAEIINYVDDLPDIKKILIIIDNIDECSQEIINFCDKIAKDLQKHCNFLKKIYSILLPAREHTVNKYFFQECFADNHLPKINEIEIIKKALSQSIDKIKTTTRQYSQSIEYPKVRGPYSYPYITVTIEIESTKIFLEKLIETIETSIFWSLCRALSNRNYKIMISNIYNFIHSCKLPIIPLFNLAFLKNFYIDHGLEIPDYVPFNTGLETLLAIHYPFYDKGSSHIINIFNLFDSVDPGNYKNTLTIIRLLCFLQNKSDQNKSLNEIREKLNKFGYVEDNVNAAIEKCFDYGLIEASHGNHLKDLSNTSEINISSIGRFYLDFLICNDTYLSFIADDTPMPSPICGDINKKYNKHEHEQGNEYITFPHIINESASDFINFIKSEEELEKQYIKDKNCKYNDFLLYMSIRKDSNPQTIGEYMESNRHKQITKNILEKYI
jgi:hypothetical protein